MPPPRRQPDALSRGPDLRPARVRRREIYHFRDEQGLEVDFLVPGRAGAVSLVECRSVGSVTPAMAVPMRRLGEALRKKRPSGARVEMTLVHQPSKSSTPIHAVAPGVRALAWQEFVSELEQ